MFINNIMNHIIYNCNKSLNMLYLARKADFFDRFAESVIFALAYVCSAKGCRMNIFEHNALAAYQLR